MGYLSRSYARGELIPRSVIFSVQNRMCHTARDAYSIRSCLKLFTRPRVKRLNSKLAASPKIILSGFISRNSQ